MKPGSCASAPNMLRRNRICCDLILRRQTSTAETVDAHDGTRARHVFQHLLHVVRVVRQFVDLSLTEDHRERIAAGIAGALARSRPT